MRNRTLYIFLSILTVVVLSVQCTKNDSDVDQPEIPGPEPEVNKTLREQYSTAPDLWPSANWFPGISKKELSFLPQRVQTESQEVVELGKILFFDSRLGKRNNSCASCHVSQNYWTDRAVIAVGGGNRNTPNLQDSWYLDGHLMLDGRARTFAEQLTIAIESPHEMAGDVKALPSLLQAIAGYRVLFQEAYADDKITTERILGALTAYTKSIVSGDTRFDRFIKGEFGALNDQQLQGLHLFRTKAACINCHNGPFFTDLQYHNLGNSLDHQQLPDYGRFNFTNLNADRGKFRTPGLRNVAHTAPYLHNGSVTSLDFLIDLLIDGMPQMNGQRVSGILSPHIKPLSLSRDERDALLAFINALSSERPEVSRPILPN